MQTPSQKNRKIKKYRIQIQLIYNYLTLKNYIKKEDISIENSYFNYPSIRRIIKNSSVKNNKLTDYEKDLLENDLFKILNFDYNPFNYNILVRIKFNELNFKILLLEPDLNCYYLIYSQLKKIAETQIKEEIINKMVNDRINDIITFKEILIEKL